MPTSSKGNLKDDSLRDQSSSHSTVHDNGNSVTANRFCPANVIPMKLDFLPSDKGGDVNSSNKPSIIDVDSDEDVMSVVEPTNNNDLANDEASTSNNNAVGTNITNNHSSNNIVECLPPTQLTTATCSTNHVQNSAMSHASSSNIQTNDNENDESITTADLVTIFKICIVKKI